MKVGIELQPCLKNRSGIGVYTYELTKRLQTYDDIDIQGNIFNFLNRNDNSKDLAGLNFSMETCRLFPYGVYSRIWNQIPIHYQVLFNQKVDVYHFFNFIVPPGVKGKVIATIHDLTFERYPETMDQKNLTRLKKNVNYSIERADKIVTISESSKQDIIKYLKVDGSKIEIIYPGVDKVVFGQEYAQRQINYVKDKYHLPDKYILYMGTIEPRKNIGAIIEAFAQLKKDNDDRIKNIKLVLAGKKGWLYESIFDKVRTLNLENDVVFTDYVEDQDKAIIYQLAKIFIFPSLYEGFGIPALEAMAAGVPVITSNSSSLPEVVGTAGILVEPKDFKGIAEAMCNILNDESLAKEMIAKGYEQVKKFSWDESARKLYELYKNI
ncbi:MAG: glycosyltransferase family 4 protein [Cellulosilyticaceae bacterium]